MWRSASAVRSFAGRGTPACYDPPAMRPEREPPRTMDVLKAAPALLAEYFTFLLSFSRYPTTTLESYMEPARDQPSPVHGVGRHGLQVSVQQAGMISVLR